MAQEESKETQWKSYVTPTVQDQEKCMATSKCIKQIIRQE